MKIDEDGSNSGISTDTESTFLHLLQVLCFHNSFHCFVGDLCQDARFF